jgi:predicted dehydrogenase
MIAQRGILPHLSQDDLQDRIRLVAVCDPAPGRAAASAERFGIAAAYETLEELLADPGVDSVSIASPIALHFEQAMAALEAGKHVHVNKTMSTTVAEADALIELAEVGGCGWSHRPARSFVRSSRRSDA